MKNQTINTAKTSIRNVAAVLTFACTFLLSTVQANAGTEIKNDKKAEKVALAAADVKYLGQYNNQPVFQLDVDNVYNDDLYVTLRDEDGNMLYGERLSGKKISKKFQFTNSGDSDLNITINLSSKNTKKVQSYKITNVSKVVRDVVVTEVK